MTTNASPESEPQPRRARIAAIVINSVSHDTRVLKQADSLARAGYEVAIFGIQDGRCDEPRTERETGVVIHRIAWKEPSHRTVARIFLVGGALTVVAAFLLYVLVLADVPAIRTAISWLGGAAVACLPALPFFHMFRRHELISRRLRRAAAMGGPIDEDGKTAIRRTDLVPGLAVVRAFVGRWTVDKVKNAVFQSVRSRQIVAGLGVFRPDAVHCHDLSTVPIGQRYARKIRGAGGGRECKVVFDSHELYEEQSWTTPMLKRVYRHRQRRVSGGLDAFITINDSIAGFLATNYPRLPDAVVVKNAALPPPDAIRYDGRLHEAADLPRGERILLYQGGFARHRGLDVLVRAGVLLPDGWTLVMMGWGAYEPTLRGIAARVDPDGTRIRFIPPAPQPELAFWTAGGTLGVIPYENVCLNHWYCTPNKLWEYPVAGVPILASPFPEMRKTIETNGTGRLLSDPVTARNVADVVASITDEDLEQMRESCRTFIERDNWSVYGQRLVELYDELLAHVVPDTRDRHDERLPVVEIAKTTPSMAVPSSQ